MSRGAFYIVVGLGLIAAAPTQAAPVTVNLTGTIDNNYYAFATAGPLGNLFNYGDTFTITTTVNQDGPPDSNGFFDSGQGHSQRWDTGNVTSFTINGTTFTVGDSVTGNDYSLAEAHTNSYDLIQSYASDNTTTRSANAGGATSTLAEVDFIHIEWYLFDNDGQNDILNFADPRFPVSINLADWQNSYMQFYAEDRETGSYAQIVGSHDPVFTNASTSSGDTGAPAPGALALLGLGLLGVGAIRRNVA